MAFPAPFVTRIKAQLKDEADDLLQALQEHPPISIRFNPFKIGSLITHNSSLITQKVPWCSNGFYLEQRPVFTLDPLFQAGCYYVQEASSMFLEKVFLQLGLQDRKLVALDACAAPGGKSTHLLSLMSKESMLVSNETISSRVSVLKENIIKWGSSNVIVTNNDPSAFSRLENLFDLIVIDAPCSGEGMFRKDKIALKKWSEQNCDLCVSRQQRILTSLLPSLKPDGYLIYCTCTFNPAENEKNVQWLHDHHDMSILSMDYLYPHKVKGEGFFISALQKQSGSDARPPRNWKEKLKVVYQPDFSEIPSHEYALSDQLDLNKFPCVDLSKEDALKYLRKDTLKIATDHKGWAIVTYQDHPLGFVKILDNRINNYYPTNWRIRMR